MGWSDAEQLLCVQESGDVLIYDMFGAYQKSFSLGQEVRDTKVIYYFYCTLQIKILPINNIKYTVYNNSEYQNFIAW